MTSDELIWRAVGASPTGAINFSNDSIEIKMTNSSTFADVPRVELKIGLMNCGFRFQGRCATWNVLIVLSVAVRTTTRSVIFPWKQSSGCWKNHWTGASRSITSPAGKPFLNREILPILERTLQFGPATVLTNGTVLKPDWVSATACRRRKTVSIHWSFEFPSTARRRR